MWIFFRAFDWRDSVHNFWFCGALLHCVHFLFGDFLIRWVLSQSTIVSIFKFLIISFWRFDWIEQFFFRLSSLVCRTVRARLLFLWVSVNGIVRVWSDFKFSRERAREIIIFRLTKKTTKKRKTNTQETRNL